MSTGIMNNQSLSYGQPVSLCAEVTFTTSGATSALTVAKNLGIVSVTQQIATSSLYLVRLQEQFVRLLSARMIATHVAAGAITAAACRECDVLVDGCNGGLAVISSVTAVPGNAVSIAGSTFTAVAYNGSTSAANTWQVGNNDDTVSATHLAAAINACTDAALVAAGVAAVVVTDAIGATSVAITGAKDTAISVTGAPFTLVGGSVLKPGVLLNTLHRTSLTPTVMATGDVAKFFFRFENSNPAP